MPSFVRSYQYVAIRLPSETIKVEQLFPSTTISLGKYGSFNSNNILGRPFYLTFEILDPGEAEDGCNLRIVPPAELHADALIDGTFSAEDDGVADTSTPDKNGVSEIQDLVKSNQNITDNPTAQKLTKDEIEILKQETAGTGKGIISKLLQSHSAIDQKTAFSLAKYTIRKNKKYLKRFTVLPLDVPLLVDWMMNDKDFTKVLELRNETLGLLGCWANVHYFADTASSMSMRRGRWLVVDETGGLVVAAVAEKIGVLYPQNTGETRDTDSERSNAVICGNGDNTQDQSRAEAESSRRDARKKERILAMSSRSNNITAIHSNSQPNLSLLKYFGFDANSPSEEHPLYTHLKTVSWLQLLEPESDPVYAEPEVIPPEVLSTWKSNRRSTYYRKRRRWERVRSVIEETRAGEFDGLVVASLMQPSSILHHAVPLLAGAAQVVIYSPHVEPVTEIADLYSTGRRAAFINTPLGERVVPSKDFPVDPTLLLGGTVQTARIRRWQALPGRTHPLMSGKGGAEGYVFHATRVIPAEGKVEARGKGIKRRKVDLATPDTQESSLVKVEPS